MKLPMWITTLFKKDRYPKPVLDKKVLEILNRVDTYLTTHSAMMPSQAVMSVKPYKIAFFTQILSTDKLVDLLCNAAPSGFVYLPRSIAFVTEADGTWCFRIAFREQIECDLDKCEMFVELLSRTNDARSN